MTPAELEESRKICEAASPGPWYVPKHGESSPKSCGLHSDYPVVTVEHEADYQVFSREFEQEEWPSVASSLFKQDADFIAHARQALPKVLSRVEALQKELAEARAQAFRELAEYYEELLRPGQEISGSELKARLWMLADEASALRAQDEGKEKA